MHMQITQGYESPMSSVFDAFISKLVIIDNGVKRELQSGVVSVGRPI